MSPVTFTKKIRNEQFAFEGHSEMGVQFFNVKPFRLGRPFKMAKLDKKNWVIAPGEIVEPEIKELERTFSVIIEQNGKA